MERRMRQEIDAGCALQLGRRQAGVLNENRLGQHRQHIEHRIDEAGEPIL